MKRSRETSPYSVNSPTEQITRRRISPRIGRIRGGPFGSIIVANKTIRTVISDAIATGHNVIKMTALITVPKCDHRSILSVNTNNRLSTRLPSHKGDPPKLSICKGNDSQPITLSVTGIPEFPKPRTARDINRRFGMISRYRQFIGNLSPTTTPIPELIGESKRGLVWDDEERSAFEQLKTASISTLILARSAFSLPSRVECVTSNLDLGAVPLQDQHGEEKITAYMSEGLSSNQRTYLVTERGGHTVIAAIGNHRPGIEGFELTALSHHASPHCLKLFKHTNERISRGASRPQTHDFEIQHRKVTQIVVPIALSHTIENIEIASPANASHNKYIAGKTAIKISPDDHIDHRVNPNAMMKHASKYANAVYKKWRMGVLNGRANVLLQQDHVKKTRRTHRIRENIVSHSRSTQLVNNTAWRRKHYLESVHAQRDTVGHQCTRTEKHEQSRDQYSQRRTFAPSSITRSQRMLTSDKIEINK